jgi:hypothetical protein
LFWRGESGRRVRRREPDCPEGDLEDPVEIFLGGEECGRELRLDKSSTVLCCTAHGGAPDTGEFSKPDFTAATVRELKYDPSRRRLDVFTFELKNLAGATPKATLQALEHTRFAHYSFLVCPRCRLRPQRDVQIRRACSRYDIGLILFDIVRSKAPIQLTNFAIEQSPPRRTPDPYDVEEFLENRFRREELERLKAIAKGRT